MTEQHYLFGEFCDQTLDVDRIRELFEQAEQVCLQDISVRDILDLLDRVGRAWRDPDYPLRVQARERLPELVGFSPEMVDRGFTELGRLLDRSQLQVKLRYELGRSSVLDGWTWRQGYDGYIRAVPLGVVTHVSPGNVFLGAADSLVHGLLTKNVNLVKVSRGDPLFPLLFARSLKEADRDGRIARSFAVFTLPDEREQIQVILRNRSDGIVIWGGADAITSWSRGAGSGVRVIPYGPRFSCALVSEQYLEEHAFNELDLSGLVEDVISWETRACGSPQVLFWPQSQSEQIPNLLEALSRKFQEWEQKLPPPERDPDVKVELRREYELTRFSALKGQAQFKAAPELTWSVQVRRWEDHRTSPLNRSLIVVPYPDVDTLLKWLYPIRRTLQSVGLAADAGEFRDLGLRLTNLGVHRITEWGKMWRAKHGGPHDGTYQLTQLIRWATVESLPERFDAERRLKPAPPSKTMKLAALLDTARGHSEYYREVLPDFELTGVRDLVKFPRLDSETLRHHTPPLGKGLLTGPLEGAYIFASGGSTGSPKFSFYSIDEWEEVTDILAAIYQKAGVTRGDTVANLFMAGNLWTSFLAVSEALEKIGCIKLPIAGNVDPLSIIAYLEMFRPTVLVGLPSLLIRLAELLEEKGKSLECRTLLYGGEHLAAETREYLKRILGATTVASAGYASVDAGPVGYQTLDQRGGDHHLLYHYQFLEFLDPETGEPVPDGEVGEITVTCLGRRLMPLIRYRTGDLGRWKDSAARIFELKGRIGDRIRVGGCDIFPSDVARLLDELPGAGHIFQLVVSKVGQKDALELKLERSTQGTVEPDDVKERLVEGISELKLGLEEAWIHAFEVTLLKPAGLRGVSRTGKIRTVVDLR